MKVYARIQRKPWLLRDTSYHNPLAWKGEERWMQLEGIAAFPVQDIWEKEGGNFDELLYTIFIEDTITLLDSPKSENLAEGWEGDFSTAHAQLEGFFVLFFFGEEIGELPDGVVVRALRKEDLPDEIIKKLAEYEFEIREDGVFTIYAPTVKMIEF